MTSASPKAAALTDYLAVLRRRRLMLVAFVLAGLVGSLVMSVTTEPRYESEAKLYFRDIAQDRTFIADRGRPDETPGQLAIRHEQSVGHPTVQEDAGSRLEDDGGGVVPSPAISTDVELQTQNLVIRGSSTDPEGAARLANAYSSALRAFVNRQERTRLNDAITSLRSEIDSAREQVADTPEAATVLFFARSRLSELQALRSIAEPATVVSEARVPTSPSSPKPVRNSLLGLALGLVLGLLAAFLRDNLDSRLRVPTEASQEFGLPIVGKVGRSALGHTGVLDGDGDVDEADLEKIRILRTNLDFMDVDKDIKVLLITSSIAEEGKSSVAASLAAAAAAAGRRTLLLECDLRRPVLADRLGLKRSPGLSDYLVGRATPQEILQSVPVPEGSSGNGSRPTEHELVCVVSGTDVPRPAELLSSHRFSLLIEQVRQVYDLVVIDSGPMLAVADPIEVAQLADGVLVCVRMNQVRRDQARSARDALSRIPDTTAGLVVTDLRDGAGQYEYYYRPVGASSS